MTLGEIYNDVKALYSACPTASEWFGLRTLMSEMLIKYGDDPMAHIVNPHKHAEYAQSFMEDVKRALAGYPLQYITGKTAFWNGEFYVGEGVLIPRSDTERTVELALEAVKPDCIVYDICCGSGCIGISLLKSRPDIKKCYCFDISDTALEYTRRNAVLNGVEERLEAVKYDVMNGVFPDGIPPAHVIVSNPPYVRNDEMPLLPENVRFEPEIALAGGEDGCDFYRKILCDFVGLLKNGGELFFEISPAQAEILSPLFISMGSNPKVFKDYRGNIRTICGKFEKKY